MKKFICSILTAAAITQTAFAGNDKGNAGDGVYVNNEIIMRDFVQGATLNTVDDNADFVARISGLKNLVAEIAQADGDVAMTVLRYLAGTTYYLSETRFPKGVNGREIMIYWMDGALLISPALFQQKDQALSIILSSLRPAHSTQLKRGTTTAKFNAELDRNFAELAKYLVNKRGKYKGSSLVNFFDNLNGEGSLITFKNTNVIWNGNLNQKLRCDLIKERSWLDSTEFTNTYFGLKCGV